MSAPQRGLLVCVRRDGELRITTETTVECFEKGRIVSMERTPMGVHVRTPDRWHEFLLAPKLAMEAMRAVEPAKPAGAPVVRKVKPPVRRSAPAAVRAARAALDLWAEHGSLSMPAACERCGVSLGRLSHLTRKGALLRARYERAVKARRALRDISAIVAWRAA